MTLSSNNDTIIAENEIPLTTNLVNILRSLPDSRICQAQDAITDGRSALEIIFGPCVKRWHDYQIFNPT